jgi:hypothetical protein
MDQFEAFRNKTLCKLFVRKLKSYFEYGFKKNKLMTILQTLDNRLFGGMHHS